MKRLNTFEAKCIDEELYLTYDIAGNIVSINCINDEPKNVVYEDLEKLLLYLQKNSVGVAIFFLKS